MAHKTISVKGIPEELWQAFRVKSMTVGKKTGEVLTELIRAWIRPESARKTPRSDS
jgi:hypothetical protein